MASRGTEEIIRVSSRGGVVTVWHARSARSIVEAEAILRAIDHELDRTGLQLLIIDSRDADRTPTEVQEHIWKWLSGHRRLRGVATVMHSAELAGKVRRTGAGHGIRLRTFNDEDAARKWLGSL